MLRRAVAKVPHFRCCGSFKLKKLGKEGGIRRLRTHVPSSRKGRQVGLGCADGLVLRLRKGVRVQNYLSSSPNSGNNVFIP